MSDEHKRLEVGANGSPSNSSGQPSAPPGHEEGMKAERPLETSDREQQTDSKAAKAAPEANTAEGEQREGMHEADGQGLDSTVRNVDDRAAQAQPSISDKSPPASSAYTASQKSNLPSGVHEEAGRVNVQGSGRLEEPVEGRSNGLVFDAATGQYVVRDEEHGSGVPPQNKT